MKWRLLSFFSLTILFFGFYSLTTDVLAVGGSNVYNCTWIGTPPIGTIPAIGTCQTIINSCLAGYDVPSPNQCSGKPYDACDGTEFPCESATDPVNGCEAKGGHFTLITFNCNYGEITPCTDCYTGFKCCADASSIGGGMVGGGPAPKTCPVGGTGFETAIGCIPVESPQGFATFFIKWAMGIAGGIALVLIGYAGFMIMTSAGNPQKLQAGKELLTAAITGLVLLLFGVFALRFVGVDILKIPGFGV